MALDLTDDPTGFEGFEISEARELERLEKSPIAFQGIGLEINGPAKKASVGFKGFCFAYGNNERFIKVTDYRGNPLEGVLVTAQNTGGPTSDLTNASGIVALIIDSAGTTEVNLEKEKTFKNYDYTHSSEPLTQTIILQPPLL